MIAGDDGLSDEDFEDALARALHGEVMTDLPLTPSMLAALLAVAAAPEAGARRRALRAARDLHDPPRDEDTVPQEDDLNWLDGP